MTGLCFSIQSLLEITILPLPCISNALLVRRSTVVCCSSGHSTLSGPQLRSSGDHMPHFMKLMRVPASAREITTRVSLRQSPRGAAWSGELGSPG